MSKQDLAAKDREYLLRMAIKQSDALEAVLALVEAALSGHAYVLPGGYPSRPVEAFALRKAISSALDQA